MAKFSIGDNVAKGKNNTGKIVAVFTTVDGELRYAVEHDGALQFVLETNWFPISRSLAQPDQSYTNSFRLAGGSMLSTAWPAL